jgi:hypothetical protein
MSEQREVTLEFLAEQQQRILSEIQILRDDVDVLAASVGGLTTVMTAWIGGWRWC